MSLQDLLKLIARLSPGQQEAVAEFVSILKKENKPDMTSARRWMNLSVSTRSYSADLHSELNNLCVVY